VLENDQTSIFNFVSFGWFWSYGSSGPYSTRNGFNLPPRNLLLHLYRQDGTG
jgi:hypothetical protein